MGHAHRPAEPPPFSEQVGLVFRAYRRGRGLSQRAFAQSVSVPQSTIARLERSAHGCSLATVVESLATTGHTLGIVDPSGELVTCWDPTDRVARDRAGRYFPAHREVRPVAPGDMTPLWWLLHEYFGTGACGSQPTWTAEGFVRPAGTRFGKVPRPRVPGEPPRWL